MKNRLNIKRFVFGMYTVSLIDIVSRELRCICSRIMVFMSFAIGGLLVML